MYSYSPLRILITETFNKCIYARNQNYTALVLDQLSFFTHERLVLCPTGSSSSSISTISGVLVMEESALLEDGGECITISGTMLSCPGEYTGFGCCCCWTSGDSLAMGCSWVAHLSDNHFLIKTMMTAIVVVIAHIKKATIIRKKVLYNLL